MISSEDLKKQFHNCMPTFVALGEEARMVIVGALIGDDPIDTRGLNVKDITQRTKLSRPAISHHLKILKNAGLVKIHREGTSNYYYLTISDSNKQMMQLCSLLETIIKTKQLKE